MNKERKARRAAVSPPARVAGALLSPAMLALLLGACSEDPAAPGRRSPATAAEPARAVTEMAPAIADALTRVVPDTSAARVRAALQALGAELAHGAARPATAHAVHAALDDYAATGTADPLDVAALRLSVDLLTTPEN